MDVAGIIPPLLDPDTGDPVGGRDTRTAYVLNPTTATATCPGIITTNANSSDTRDRMNNATVNPTTAALSEQKHPGLQPASNAAPDPVSASGSGVSTSGYELHNLTSTSAAPAPTLTVTSPAPISTSTTLKHIITPTHEHEQINALGQAHRNPANIFASSSMPPTPGTPGYELPGAYPGGEDDAPSTAVSYINAGAQSAAAYLSQSVRAYLRTCSFLS